MSAVTSAYVYRPGEAEVRWMGETSTSFLAMGDQTDDAFALVDERAHRGETVPLHRHPDDRESFYVIDGEISFYVGDEPGARVGAGSFVHVPGGTVHGFRIESETARYLILTTPRHGEFYKAITLPSDTGGLPPRTPVEGALIGKAVGEYGIEFVGPLPEGP
ncbi:cupin domain-containing protein [Gaiella sp.]|uniref:cupin domain-containing protein n=1 Tax=Gaiella sp. TaxID=2663207 RepID=UPI003265AAA5